MKTRTLQIITYFLLTLITIMIWSSILAQSHTRVLGAPTLPGSSRLGKTGFQHPGTSFETEKSFRHYAISQIGINAKLFPGSRIDNNSVLMLDNPNAIYHICYMDIIKQHVVMSLIRSGRYTLDHETGSIISHIGKEQRVMKPIVHYSGYLQYNLDIGFNRIISVYGQGFSYLAKWLTPYDPAFVIDHIDRDKSNNRPDNLRCITEKQNLSGEWKRGGKSGQTKTRLPIDVKEAIKADHAQGVSFVRLAEKYKCTRQTIAKIIKC